MGNNMAYQVLVLNDGKLHTLLDGCVLGPEFATDWTLTEPEEVYRKVVSNGDTDSGTLEYEITTEIPDFANYVLLRATCLLESGTSGQNRIQFATHDNVAFGSGHLVSTATLTGSDYSQVDSFLYAPIEDGKIKLHYDIESAIDGISVGVVTIIKFEYSVQI